MPAGSWTEAELGDWVERLTEWIFDDAVESDLGLDETLVWAADRILQELNEPLRKVTGAPWPPSKVAPWPVSEHAGVDTNRQPWATLREGTIHLGYGEGETAALVLEPIRLDDLRG
jgi:hypothetical protein